MIESNVIDDIAGVLHRVSGLPPFEERLCAYYVLSTRFVKQLNPFPILCVIGAPGTGKTELLKAIAELSEGGLYFPGSKFSGPAFRDKLALAHDGTAVIDEAESEDKSRNITLEGYLNLRYMRDTAIEEKKFFNKKTGQWLTIIIEFYGPTILGKRLPYRDGSLGGRSIMVSTHGSDRRDFITINEINPDVTVSIKDKMNEAYQAIGIGSFTQDSITRGVPEGALPRVVDTYKPTIALALALDDKKFLRELWDWLWKASENLRSDQQDEAGPLVVQALIMSMAKGDAIAIRHVKLQGDLVKTIQMSFDLQLSAKQVAYILRGYGFTLKKYGGPVVVFPTVRDLHRVCRQIGYRDEMVERAYDALDDRRKERVAPYNPWDTEEE